MLGLVTRFQFHESGFLSRVRKDPLLVDPLSQHLVPGVQRFNPANQAVPCAARARRNSGGWKARPIVLESLQISGPTEVVQYF